MYFLKYYVVYQRFFFSSRFRIFYDHAKTDVLVKRNLALCRAVHEFFAHTRAYDDRKFQSLALVYGHDSDHIVIFSQKFHLSGPDVVFIYIFNIADETVK